MMLSISDVDSGCYFLFISAKVLMQFSLGYLQGLLIVSQIICLSPLGCLYQGCQDYQRLNYVYSSTISPASLVQLDAA